MFGLCFFLGNEQEINTYIKSSVLGDSIEDIAHALQTATCDNRVISFWDNNSAFHCINMGEVSYFRLEDIKED